MTKSWRLIGKNDNQSSLTLLNLTDYLNEGDMVRVKCLDIDQRGRIKLSIKEAKREDEGGTLEQQASEAE